MDSKTLTITEDYSSPQVRIIRIEMSSSPLCGSFTGAEIPKYEEEDIFGDD